MNFKGKMREKSGITLITLAVTIIILLILAGITIATITSDNGIIKNANDAKEQTEIAEEKEIVDRATIQAMGNNKRGNLVEDELQEQLDKITDNGKTEVSDNGEEFEVVFVDSNRYYNVDKDGNIIEEGKIVVDKSPGDITKDENGDDIEEGQPYEIWCIEDLIVFSNMVNGEGIIIENGKAVEINTSTDFRNKTVELKTNLNFKSKYSYADSERTDFGDINGIEDDGNILMDEMTTGTGFKPIGLDVNGFSGEFNGENNKINNLYINYENDTVLNGYNIGRCVGLFSRGNNKTIIKNLTVSGEIKGKGHAGGIIGKGAKLIENCTNNANVTGYNMVGGISANTYGNITSCQNYGTITITGMSFGYGGAGGIKGTVIGTGNIIKDCMNEGKILGSTSRVGGIVGTIEVNGNVEINGCYNTGKSNNAGILGFMRNGIVTVANSYNLGECRNGIVGSFSGEDWDRVLELNIQNSYNLGKVSNAGIIGTEGTSCRTITLNIDNCYNAGESDKAIVGTIDKHRSTETVTNIENTYYEVTKSSSIGAISEGITEMNIQNNTSFVEILNNNIGSNTTWKTWKLGENGYPIFE